LGNLEEMEEVESIQHRIRPHKTLRHKARNFRITDVQEQLSIDLLSFTTQITEFQ